MTAMRLVASLLFALAALAALPVVAQDARLGEEKYMQFCNKCHGFPPDAAARRGAGDIQVIKDSRRFSGAKGILGPPFVYDSDFQDIAEWLRNPVNIPPPPPPPPPPAVVPAFDYTDLWWNPAEPGWGLNLIQHAGTNAMFGVLYTYDASRRPLWLVLPGGRWDGPLQYSGDLYRTRGPRFNQDSFDTSRVSAEKVGNFILEFAGANTGTFTYFVDGERVQKPIARQPF
jgi:hypothetical protein